jgi:uncharacterized protein with FMN-binding domain
LRRVILAICATAAALVALLSFKTHMQPVPSALGTPAPGGTAGASGAAPQGSPATATASAAGTRAAGAARTVTGDAVDTIYGPVQVRITVAGGKVTAASAVEYPQETPRDQQINSFAIPQLNAEAVTAGSAGIDAVSGATYTSQGYIGSLQSALDKARA